MAKQSLNRLWLKLYDLTPWIAAAFVALTVNWAADGTKEVVDVWMKGERVEGWVGASRAIYLILFAAAATWLYLMRTRLFQPRTRFLRNESPEKREHLVLFLSNLDTARRPFQDGVPEGVILTGDLDEDLAAFAEWKKRNPYWPWEMPLRAIRHHLGRLSTVTVICSSQSIQQAHWFGQVVARYPTVQGVPVRVFSHEADRPAMVECPKTPPSRGGWDFERFDDLSRAMLHLLREFKKQQVRDDQIMIDFTGGQKVTSVVAASVTFNRKIKAQYVQTNPPHEVISYDILLGSPETGGLGL